MRIVSVAVVAIGVLAGAVSSLRAGAAEQRVPTGSTPAPAPASAPAAADAGQVVATYCSGCHNGLMRSASGAVLGRLDAASMADDPAAWTKAWRQMRAGTMPPVGAPRPDARAVEAVLASIETALDAVTPPAARATSEEIAVRLAEMLWNSAPDESLRQDAVGNRLTDPEIVRRQVVRMLADERARSVVDRFFFPWLGLDTIASIEPDRALFPEFDASLRDAMMAETELFILSQLRDDRDPIDLWNADYTFVNERLARHYGVTGITGPQFRRITLSMPERAGLLGQASVLMATSRHKQGQPAYTSPAARAIWVRLHFLGATPPNPAPNAAPVSPELPITPQTRALPAQPCINCHRNFFPLGYALEHFDTIGRWRTHDQAGPVDDSGTFVDGSTTNGVVELRNVLLQHPDAFRTTIAEKLIEYAGGRPPSAAAMAPPATLAGARRILRGTTDRRWSALIAAVVSSQR